MKVHALCLSASALALAWSGVAAAQSAPPSGDRSGAVLEEVVVTAERRTENLQKTPISATVISGGDLEKKGVMSIDALQFITPSVTINNFGQGIDFNVRGIGKAEHNSQTLTGVITYRDGVPTFPGYVQEEPYYDISSIEILRGPQGTLVGQNATGGAVFVTTNNPIIDGGYHGYVQGQYGNYNDVGVQGSVNIPISKTFAARIAVFGDARDSFYDITGPNGQPYTGNPGKLRWAATRISLLWKPTESLSVLSKTDLDYLDNGAYPADPVLSSNDIFHITANAPQQGIDRFVRQSLKIDYILPKGVTFRSVSAFQQASTDYMADLDGTAAGINTFADDVHERIWSEEINLISPNTGLFTWVLGGFAQGDRYNFIDPYRFVIGVPPGSPFSEYTLQGKNPKTNYAAFGQVSLNLPAGFQVQGGARYSIAKTTNHVQVMQYGTPIIDEQTAKYKDWSYKVGVNWTVNPNQFLYAFVATGARPGGLNVPVGFGQPAPFISEHVTEYEVGWKATFLGGHLRTDIDGFYNDYKNFQVTVGYPTFPTFGFELNVPTATKIYGAEAEAEAVFGDLSFDGGVAIMHSKLGSFFASDSRIASVTPCDPVTGPASASCISLVGKRQTYAPNFTFNLGGQYDFRLGNGDKITPRMNFGHVSPQWATLFENLALGDRIESRNILGAQLGWTHGDFIATLYGTNLTNQHYVAAINTGLRLAGAPRQYGIRLFKLF